MVELSLLIHSLVLGSILGTEASDIKNLVFAFIKVSTIGGGNNTELRNVQRHLYDDLAMQKSGRADATVLGLHKRVYF